MEILLEGFRPVMFRLVVDVTFDGQHLKRAGTLKAPQPSCHLKLTQGSPIQREE